MRISNIKTINNYKNSINFSGYSHEFKKQLKEKRLKKEAEAKKRLNLKQNFQNLNPKIEKICQDFKKETGVNLYIPCNNLLIYEFNLSAGQLYKAIKAKKFPGEIKNIIISHGKGNIRDNNWGFTNNVRVFDWIDKYIKDNELCLLGVCEESKKQKGYPKGFGTLVEASFCDKNAPGKIILSGRNVLVGSYTIQGGIKYL